MEHLTETIYYPGKPEWKPITITLYDLRKEQSPLWDWIYSLYDLPNNRYLYSVGFKKEQAILTLYDGQGLELENWFFESVWCQDIVFGELDMSDSGICTVDITLRYDRAYYQF